ncbi:MAG: aminotransferase [Anaerolineales bacterium]|nr:aminotransferase class V-fold PLP-dependent enzyme [Anaerolineae bacterium]PWB51634.1 MAG: aminotransferase [Anaerolineales bacterium]
MSTSHTHNFSPLFVGLDAIIPLLDGTHRCYINLDNAASTPPLKAVQHAVDDFLVYYSSVHRGTGFKSLLSTYSYEQARAIIMDFVGVNATDHTCIFGKNTTEAINKLARRLPLEGKRRIILTTGMEHHSNDLPWRAASQVIHVKLTPDGRLDEQDFDQQLFRYADEIALVTLTGASNVTGFLNPIHALAEKVHAVGALFMVDCAQLAPHRKIDMRSLDDPTHLDFITISAHKLYAPFGTGALIGRKDVFEQGDPDLTGGGTVEIVTLDSVVWTSPPERDEAGSPNVVGAVALAAAIRQLESVGMDAVAAHEADLTRYTLQKLNSLEDCLVFGDTDPLHAIDRLGVIPLQLKNIPHFLAAAVLGYEFGIGVRSGCFCAHPYILHLLGLSPEQAAQVRLRMLAGDKSEMPGLIRASFGLYNTLEEVDILIDALERISRGDYKGKYTQDKSTGEYSPVDWKIDYSDYYRL